MKTVYECIVSDYSYDREFAFFFVKKLTELSKSWPWLLDPKVKFKNFYLSMHEKAITFYTYERGWISIDVNKNKIEDLNSFVQYVTKQYNLKPGWMTIEDSV